MLGPIDLFHNIPTKLPTDFRVLHTADWHLGKPLGDLSRQEEHARFLDFLLHAIRDHDVDALLVAGDVFDSAHPPQSAVAQYFRFISELRRTTNAAMIVTAGNHDSPAHLEAPRELLEPLRVHVVGRVPKKVKDLLIPLPHAAAPQVVIAALPFLRDRDLRTGAMGQSAVDIREQLVTGIHSVYQKAARSAAEWRKKGIPLMAMGHLTAQGGNACPESERDIHIGGLGAVGEGAFGPEYSYVALGHLHRPQKIGPSNRIRYSGSPLPLSFAEAADEKEMRVVDFAEGGMVGCYALRLPLERRLVQWRLQFDELALYLQEKQPPRSPLTPWVEVIVSDAPPGENLYQTVQELAKDRPYQIVRVVNQTPSATPVFRLGQWTGGSEASDLLAAPERVFGCRLDEAADLSEAERETLQTAFRELLSLHQEQERESSGTPSFPAPTPSS